MSTLTPCQSLESFPVVQNISEFQGIAGSVFQDIAALPSVVVLEKFRELANIQGVAFVGSSCSGKTAILKSVLTSIAKSPDVVIPKRYITTAPRQEDDPRESCCITAEYFMRKVERGEFFASWAKGSTAYGFEKTDGTKLPLYFANNDFFRNVDCVRRNILILGIYAPDEIRQQRLLSHSPHTEITEMRELLGEPSMTIVPHVHVILKNFGETEESTLKDVCTLIQSVVHHRVPFGQFREVGLPFIEFRSSSLNIMNHKIMFSDGSFKIVQSAEQSPEIRTLVIHRGKFLLSRELREETVSWEFSLPGGMIFDDISKYSDFLEHHPERAAIALEARKTATKKLCNEMGMPMTKVDMQLSSISQCDGTVKRDLYYFCVDIQEGVPSLSPVMTQGGAIVEYVWVDPQQVLAMCVEGKVPEERTSNFLLRRVLAQGASGNGEDFYN